jgi:hypothetical protein
MITQRKQTELIWGAHTAIAKAIGCSRRTVIKHLSEGADDTMLGRKVKEEAAKAVYQKGGGNA